MGCIKRFNSGFKDEKFDEFLGVSGDFLQIK